MSKQKSWLDAYDKDKGWTTSGKSTSGWSSGTGSYKRCYHDHPILPIGDHVVCGGSCSSPIHNDADIYVGLDYSMKAHKQRLPWVDGHAIHYEIKDMNPPDDPVEFMKLIEWLAGQIWNGKKVHIGCIGGHGRTGTVLSALVAWMTEEPDPIAYVRQHYCTKAVESKSQVDFLMKHFGCKQAKPTKGGWTSKGTSKKANKKAGQTVQPIAAKHRIWGDLSVERD